MRAVRRPTLAALASAVAILPALAGGPVAQASSFTRCHDDASFFVAIYVQGIPCDLSHNVLSTWNAHREACHKHTHCSFTYGQGIPGPKYHLSCSNSHRVDHKSRHYIALACFSDDRRHDIRARYYPRGDYQPDR
jgi:hypothetical protein